MNNINTQQYIYKIKKELKSKKYNLTKVCNFTGLSMEKCLNLMNDKKVELTEDEIWCLNFRLSNKKFRKNLLE